MLQPLKPTNPTDSTEATEATSEIRPISEQRPGNTLRDRLYRKPEITGGWKMPSEKGNKTSLFQEYSLAKFLPTTPLTPLPPADPGSTFSTFAGKYTSYADYWSGLGAYQKQESKQEFVSDKYGTAMIDSELKPYMDRYGLRRGLNFLKSLASADKLQANRQNPFFQPIMLKNIDRYFSDDEALALTRSEKFGEKGRRFSGILGGQDITLNKGEIDKLRKIAEDNGLGQTGFQELLDRTYQQKFTGAATSFLPKVVDAVNNPATADWNELSQGLSFNTSWNLSAFEGLTERLQSQIADPWGAGLGGAVSNIVGDVSEAANLGNPIAEAMAKIGIGSGTVATGMGWAGAIGAVVGAIGAMAQTKQQEKWGNANFSPIKDGKLVTTIDGYSGSEKNNIKEISETMGIDPNEFTKALAAMQISALYGAGKKVEDLKTKYSEGNKGDRAIEFGDGALTLSKTYNPFGGTNV